MGVLFLFPFQSGGKESVSSEAHFYKVKGGMLLDDLEVVIALYVVFAIKGHTKYVRSELFPFFLWEGGEEP